MDLGLDIFRPRALAEPELTGSVVRELTPTDLAAPKAKVSTIKRLSDRHHALARSVAAGLSNIECAAIHGYTPSTVSSLKGDPAFQELVEFYHAKADAAMADLHVRLSGLSAIAAAILLERLEENPEKFSAEELRELLKLGADRTGHGPQSKNTQVNINVNLADRLQAARQRVANAKVIDA